MTPSDINETPRADLGREPGLPPWRGVLGSIIIDGLCPLLTYLLLTGSGKSQVVALAVGAIFPAVNGLASIVRRRSVDIIGVVVLIGIAISILATLLGGDPKLLLIRESFVTGALGLVCLLSLMWPRPLMFYIARQFSASDDPIKAEAFNQLWQRPRARRTFRVLTVAWGVSWVGEFALRVGMVETLSIPTVLVVSPIVFNGLTVGMLAWTFAYVRRQRRAAATATPN